jgi:CheY-like chemotaxis protein
MMVPERDNMYGKGYKVFVVDDNGVFLSTLSKWLNEMNLSVKTFLSAEECLILFLLIFI